MSSFRIKWQRPRRSAARLDWNFTFCTVPHKRQNVTKHDSSRFPMTSQQLLLLLLMSLRRTSFHQIAVDAIPNTFL